MPIYVKFAYFDRPLNVVGLTKAVIVHSLGLYAFYLAIIGYTKLYTVLWHLILFYTSILGITVGVHRLWSHRSYKASRVVELILIVVETFTGLESVYQWTLDHRIHHKFVDTDADPHTITRGLFYAQVGWVWMHKSDQYLEKLKTIDMSDLESDRAIMFQHKYYEYIRHVMWGSATLVPWYFWQEHLLVSFFTLLMGYIIEAHQVMTINSLAHTFGWRPYDTGIEPTFSRLVSYLTLGEGYHNFHHTFPKDYSQCEVKWTRNFNVTALIIDALDFCGLVSYKNVTDPDIVAKRRKRTGDTSVRIASLAGLLDYIMGAIVFPWVLWLILILRHFITANESIDFSCDRCDQSSH